MGTGGPFFGRDVVSEYIRLHSCRPSAARRAKRRSCWEQKLAEKLGRQIGDKVTLLTTTMRRGPNAATFTITGLMDFRVAAMQQNYFYIPLDKAQSILKMERFSNGNPGKIRQ